MFIFAGMRPNSGLLKNQLKLDDNGYIEVDKLMRTSLNDVFAAGDIIAKPYRQITTSVSDGTIAAITISRELDN